MTLFNGLLSHLFRRMHWLSSFDVYSNFLIMKWISFYLIAMACIVFPAGIGAKVTIPSILGSNMVLQRNDRANIWGKASPGAKVNVTTSWDSRTYSAKADKEGNGS